MSKDALRAALDNLDGWAAAPNTRYESPQEMVDYARRSLRAALASSRPEPDMARLVHFLQWATRHLQRDREQAEAIVRAYVEGNGDSPALASSRPEPLDVDRLDAAIHASHPHGRQLAMSDAEADRWLAEVIAREYDRLGDKG